MRWLLTICRVIMFIAVLCLTGGALVGVYSVLKAKPLQGAEHDLRVSSKNFNYWDLPRVGRVYRVIDKEADMVCWVSGSGGIDCTPLQLTKLRK